LNNRVRIAYAGIYGQKGPLYGYVRNSGYIYEFYYVYSAHWDTTATKWYSNCVNCYDYSDKCLRADWNLGYKIGGSAPEAGGAVTVGNGAAGWTDEDCTLSHYFGCVSYPGEAAQKLERVWIAAGVAPQCDLALQHQPAFLGQQ
jgi:hypothetical protein